MIGWILGFVGTFFGEVEDSIAKHKSKESNIFRVGTITNFFALSIFLLLAGYKRSSDNFDLSMNPESIGLLTIRMFLEVLQAHVSFQALKCSDRSTFSVIRILTIPLMVMVDISLGYSFTYFSLLGIGVIVVSFLFFNTKNKTLDFTGWYYVLFTAVNAVITISLFKYSITHFGNSIEVDQSFAISSVFLYFFIGHSYYYRHNALGYILKDKMYRILGLSIAISTALISYSYAYLNASEATTLKRAGAMFWAIIFGTVFFQEKHLKKKLLFAFIIAIGIVVMMF